MEKFKNIEFKAQYKHSFNTSYTNKQGERVSSRGYVWEAIKPTALVTEGIEDANGTRHKTDNTFVRWEFNPNKVDTFNFYVGKDKNELEVLKIGRNMEDERFADDLEMHKLRKLEKVAGKLKSQAIINAYVSSKFNNQQHTPAVKPVERIQTIEVTPEPESYFDFPTLEWVDGDKRTAATPKQVKCLKQALAIDRHGECGEESLLDDEFIAEIETEFKTSGKALPTKEALLEELA